MRSIDRYYNNGIYSVVKKPKTKVRAVGSEHIKRTASWLSLSQNNTVVN